MSLKHKKFKNEKGFAIALALLMLVVMSLMGATLMVVAAGDHKRNSNIDTSQQAFYAAETGISEAKKWLASQTNLNPQGDPNNKLRFCKVNLFPELSNAKAINNYTETKTLNQVISGTADEKRLLVHLEAIFQLGQLINLVGVRKQLIIIFIHADVMLVLINVVLAKTVFPFYNQL